MELENIEPGSPKTEDPLDTNPEETAYQKKIRGRPDDLTVVVDEEMLSIPYDGYGCYSSFNASSEGNAYGFDTVDDTSTTPLSPPSSYWWEDPLDEDLIWDETIPYYAWEDEGCAEFSEESEKSDDITEEEKAYMSRYADDPENMERPFRRIKIEQAAPV